MGQGGKEIDESGRKEPARERGARRKKESEKTEMETTTRRE